MVSIFLKAVADKRVPEYVAGYGNYSYDIPSIYDEPQEFFFAAKTDIIPSVARDGGEDLARVLFSAIVDLINRGRDRNRGAYCAISMAYALFREAIDSKFYDVKILVRDLISQYNIVELAAEYLDVHRAELSRDLRWAGAAWNSENGLVKPIGVMIAEISGMLAEVDRGRPPLKR